MKKLKLWSNTMVKARENEFPPRSSHDRSKMAQKRESQRRLRCYGAAREDYAIAFLVNPDVPNEIVWNILSFWRATD